MKQLIPALFTVGAVMVLAGAAVYITGWQLAPYIYTVGATLVALAQINSPSKSQAPNVNVAPPADIRRASVGADRCVHALYAWQRVDCLFDSGGGH